MKKLLMACAAALFIFSGCDLLNDNSGNSSSGDSKNTYKDKWYDLVNEDVHTPSIDRGILTYGDHTYEVKGNIDFDFDIATMDPHVESTVEFTNIPSGFNEFKAVYENLLGKSPQGVAAMIPMMMEIYARDPETGEKCLRLIAKEDYVVTDILRVLKSKFPRSTEAEKDKYMQRYLPAACLKGADLLNDYAPEEPYTVELGAEQPKPQQTSMSPYGTVYYVALYCSGWDSTSRKVEIFLPLKKDLYKLQACSSCYTQCKDILEGPWKGLK